MALDFLAEKTCSCIVACGVIGIMIYTRTRKGSSRDGMVCTQGHDTVLGTAAKVDG